MPSETPGAGSAEPQIDWDALARYLAGESPAAEREAVQQWLAKQPADSKMLGALDGALDAISLDASATAGIDVEAALAKVNTRRRRETAAASQVKPIRTLAKPSRFGWLPLAAAAAIVLVVGTLVRRNTVASSGGTATIAARTFTTAVGGRDSLQLPDGSSVVLGPGSHLTLAAGYGQQERSVSLEGEAYFDVKHDGARPFMVRANGATIRDVGTSFGVHADSMGGVRVAVKSGTVELNRAVGPKTAPAVLHAGDVGVVALSGEVTAEPGAGTDDDLAWTRGKLVFRDATMADVRDDLRRWYGVELVAADSLLSRHITATFENRDSIGNVFKTIEFMLPATIERRGDTAFVRAASGVHRRK